MKILLATTSNHKKNEFEEILSPAKILLPADIGVNYHADETGDTFAANALIKAKALWVACQGKYPVLSDDSGLCVRALDGAPGVISARWGAIEAGRQLTDGEKNQLLLKKMEGKLDRFAWYVCSLVYYFGDDRFFLLQETFEGEIDLESRGTGGFGYDPLFLVSDLGKTVGELDSQTKHQLSHRGKAARSMKKILEELR